MLDGKRYDDPTGKYYVGDEQALLKAFWKNRDPRFNRACLYNGREWRLLVDLPTTVCIMPWV